MCKFHERQDNSVSAIRTSPVLNVSLLVFLGRASGDTFQAIGNSYLVTVFPRGNYSLMSTVNSAVCLHTNRWSTDNGFAAGRIEIGQELCKSSQDSTLDCALSSANQKPAATTDLHRAQMKLYRDPPFHLHHFLEINHFLPQIPELEMLTLVPNFAVVQDEAIFVVLMVISLFKRTIQNLKVLRKWQCPLPTLCWLAISDFIIFHKDSSIPLHRTCYR